jgi:hypothetical protein
MLLRIVLVYCSWRFLPSAPRALLLGTIGSGTGFIRHYKKYDFGQQPFLLKVVTSRWQNYLW